MARMTLKRIEFINHEQSPVVRSGVDYQIVVASLWFGPFPDNVPELGRSDDFNHLRFPLLERERVRGWITSTTGSSFFV